MASSQSKNISSRHTLPIFLFLIIFLLSIFIFTKRALEPSLSPYSDPNSQETLISTTVSQNVEEIETPQDSISEKESALDENVETDPTPGANNGSLADPDDEKHDSTESQNDTQNVGTESVKDSMSEKEHNLEENGERGTAPGAKNESLVDTEDEKTDTTEAKNGDDDDSNFAADDFEAGSDGGGGSKMEDGERKETKVDDFEGKVGESGIGVNRQCDLYSGKWVKDDEYPIYKPGTCPYVDEAFSCQDNGRPDTDYLKWRWQPYGCQLPRFNASDFLERLRGKRLMLVGDSMNRNMFESILCVLREGLRDKSRMHETHGYKISKGRGYFVFKFVDYDCTVEFVRSHFLVKEGVRINAQGNSNPTLSIDRIDKTSGRWRRADILIFNTAHWWSHGKTARGKNYYKEGDYIYPQFDAVEAYRRAIKTWAKWVDSNVNKRKQLVFYRAYSSAHFRGGDWDSGGTCNGETEPIKDGAAFLNTYPLKMKIVEEVIKDMKVPVILLNVTRLTNFRKDGHPSVYGKKGSKLSLRRQDCSHWCLPGVPDAWNELIYYTLLFQQTSKRNT